MLSYVDYICVTYPMFITPHPHLGTAAPPGDTAGGDANHPSETGQRSEVRTSPHPPPCAGYRTDYRSFAKSTRREDSETSVRTIWHVRCRAAIIHRKNTSHVRRTLVIRTGRSGLDACSRRTTLEASPASPRSRAACWGAHRRMDAVLRLSMRCLDVTAQKAATPIRGWVSVSTSHRAA